MRARASPPGSSAGTDRLYGMTLLALLRCYPGWLDRATLLTHLERLLDEEQAATLLGPPRNRRRRLAGSLRHLARAETIEIVGARIRASPAAAHTAQLLAATRSRPRR